MEDYGGYVGRSTKDNGDETETISTSKLAGNVKAEFKCKRESWWGESGEIDRERDNINRGTAGASGELAARLQGYAMAEFLKTTVTGVPTGSAQYHLHGHPAMGMGTHPHPHSHVHPGGPHPGLPSPFSLATHGHPHGHPLEHSLSAFPQGKFPINSS